VAKPTMTLQLDPAFAAGGVAHLTLIASDTGTEVGFATAAELAVAGERTARVGRARTVTIGTTNGSPTVTGTFKSTDEGKPITGTGIPADTRIIAVSDAGATLSENATATGAAVTATVDVDGLVTFTDVNPNSGSSDDVIDDPTGTAWELALTVPGARPNPVYFHAPDESGVVSITAHVTLRPGGVPPSGTVTILETMVEERVGDLTDVTDLPEALRTVVAGDDLLVIQDDGLYRADASDVLARANHTGTQLASTISNFDTQVRTSRIDQMAAPTSALTWSQPLTLGDGEVLHGSIGLGASVFGPAIAMLGSTGDTQAKAIYTSTQLAFGPGGSSATDTVIARTGVAALGITGTVTVSAGLTVTAGSVSLPAGSVANAALATNPLARASHTGTQTASTISDFDTQVRTSRIDQMTAPTAGLTWSQPLQVTQATAQTSTAGDGQAILGASSFFGGGILLLKENSGDAQVKASYTGGGMNLGPGGSSALDVTVLRSAANTLTITATTTVIAGNLSMSARNIITDTTTGLKIGTATTQKLGFFNATPVVRRTLAATATDAATTQTLANSLRQALIDLGLGA
jgi:hypothetical protein